MGVCRCPPWAARPGTDPSDDGRHRGTAWLRDVLRDRRRAPRRERRGPCAHDGRRLRRRRAGAAVPLLADGAERRQPPTRRPAPQEAREPDDLRPRGILADPLRLYVPRAVRRPRPDLRQDERDVRPERAARAAARGSLPQPRPRLALRRGPDRSRIGRVLRGGRDPPQERHDRRGRRDPCEGRLRSAPRRGRHREGEADRDHPRPEERREPRGRADAPGLHPLPQPGRRHASEFGARRAALREGAQDRHEPLPVDAPHGLPAAHLPRRAS